MRARRARVDDSRRARVEDRRTRRPEKPITDRVATRVVNMSTRMSTYLPTRVYALNPVMHLYTKNVSTHMSTYFDISKYHRDVSTLRRMSTFCRSRVVTYKRPPSIAPVRFVCRFSLCAAALTDAGEDDDDDGNDDERKHEEHEDDDAAARTRTRCEDGRATTRANDALR